MSRRVRDGASATELEHALDDVRGSLERFMFELARLLAGHDATSDAWLDAALAARLRRAVEPLLDSGLRMRPDFGHFAELRVVGDLVRGRTAQCVLRFTDQSALERSDGRRERQFNRGVTLTLVVALRPCRIVSCGFAVDDAA